MSIDYNDDSKRLDEEQRKAQEIKEQEIQEKRIDQEIQKQERIQEKVNAVKEQHEQQENSNIQQELEQVRENTELKDVHEQRIDSQIEKKTRIQDKFKALEQNNNNDKQIERTYQDRAESIANKSPQEFIKKITTIDKSKLSSDLQIPPRVEEKDYQYSTGSRHKEIEQVANLMEAQHRYDAYQGVKTAENLSDVIDTTSKLNNSKDWGSDFKETLLDSENLRTGTDKSVLTEYPNDLEKQAQLEASIAKEIPKLRDNIAKEQDRFQKKWDAMESTVRMVELDDNSQEAQNFAKEQREQIRKEQEEKQQEWERKLEAINRL